MRSMTWGLVLVALVSAGCGGSKGSDPKKAETTTTTAGASSTSVTFHFTGLTPANAMLSIGCGGETPKFPIIANFLADGVDGPTVCGRLADPAIVDRLSASKPPCPTPEGAATTATATGTVSGKKVSTTFYRGDACGDHDWDAMSGVLPTV